MTPTIKDLGQKVKAKYPGSYDDIDDVELGRRIKTKFPGSYDDFSDTASTPGMEKLGGTPPAAGKPPKVNMLQSGEAESPNYPVTPLVGGPMALAQKGVDQMTGGVKQAVGGAERMAQPGLLNKAGGASAIIRGTGQAAAPMVLPYAAATAAVPTAVAMAGGSAASALAHSVLKYAKAPDEVADLGSDIAGIAGGGYAAKKVPNLPLGEIPGKVGTAISDKLQGGADLHNLMVRAVKPPSRATGFPETLERSMPEMKLSEQQTGKPINNIDDALGALQHAKQRVWSQYEQMAGPQRAMGATVDLNPVADAIEGSISDKLKLENPQAAAALQAQADKYRARFPLQKAESFLKTTNAELNSYYAKNPAAKRVAASGNPDTAALEAQSKAYRDAIYNTLDDGSEGAAPREIKQRYGALMQLEDNLERRRTVAARQQPESLSEQIGKWSAVGQAVKGGLRMMGGDVTGAADVGAAIAQRKAASMLKEAQTTDALIRRAFRNYDKAPAPVNIPQQPTPAGLLGRGPTVTPPPPDPSKVTVTTGPPLKPQAAPPSRQLPRGAIRTPVPPDPSKVKAEPAMPVVDPETGEILYYTTEAASKQSPYRTQ